MVVGREEEAEGEGKIRVRGKLREVIRISNVKNRDVSKGIKRERE